MSPVSSSFELLGHTAANNPDAAVELMELMWGFMLDGPGMTNSTLIEGYRTDGYPHYVAYWSAARNSHAHGWSAGPTSVLVQDILGIQLLSPLGRDWRIEPNLTRWLRYARGGFATKLGKFQVSVSLKRSRSTGRKIEALNITVPQDSSGVLVWGGRSRVIDASSRSTVAIYRFLDVNAKADGDWQTWSATSIDDFVEDDTWVKPTPIKRPKGIYNPELLEDGIRLSTKGLKAPEVDESLWQGVTSPSKEALDAYKARLLATPGLNEETLARLQDWERSGVFDSPESFGQEQRETDGDKDLRVELRR